MDILPAKKLTLFTTEGRMWKRTPLYRAVLEELSRAGIKQAEASRAIAGYRKGGATHTSTIEVLSIDMPVVVEAIDLEEKIAAVLPAISAMAAGALIEVTATTLIGGRNDSNQREGETV